MRKLIPPLVITSLLLSGCGAPSNDNSQGGNAPVAAPSAVTGTVSLADKSVTLTAQAKLDLTLLDVTQQPGVPVNTQSFAPAQLPLQFKLDFPPAQIKQNDIYVLQAQMEDNGRVYTTSLQTPVLTHGASAQVNLVLVAEPTASDKMLADFKNVQSRIGGMKMTQGTALSADASRGWQVFSDKKGVQFVRELVDRGDKGNFTSTDYAFQDGRPWVVDQQTMPHKGEKPTSEDRAGWDENGNLVLKDHVEGGKTTELSGDAAKALHDQAGAILKQFGKGKKK